MPKAPKKKTMYQTSPVRENVGLKPSLASLVVRFFFFLMLRSITYKVVNDADDALNVFAEMVSIKLALQSLRENRKKDSLP